MNIKWRAREEALNETHRTAHSSSGDGTKLRPLTGSSNATNSCRLTFAKGTALKGVLWTAFGTSTLGERTKLGCECGG